MDPEAVISLFDSYWFNFQILNKKPNPSSSLIPPKNPDHKIEENHSESKIFASQLLVVTRSKIELLNSNSGYNSDSFSPVSVLPESHFQTSETEKPNRGKNRGNRGRRRTGRKNGENGSVSKSLSELEFEELKGFLDLGFEFSEEDLNSSLVEIIPGLQKLGKKEEEEEKSPNCCNNNKGARARPYLSEAWEAMEKEKMKKKKLMNWRIPAISNEIDMKDSLKWWAHTVASTVR